jgi:hypothetical protein
MSAQNGIGPILLALTVLLSACGPTATAQTPEDVHAGWVQALRENDREALLNLAADSEFRETTVDGYLTRMQDYLTHGYTALGVNGGAFQSVDVLTIADAGQGKTGFSRWRFERVEICYVTTLTATKTGWKVLSWGQHANCPAA